MPDSAHQGTDAWRSANLVLFALLLITLLFNYQTVEYLAGLWGQLFDGEYAHGYLVLGISCYLIWRERKRLKAFAPCPSVFALTGVFVSSLLMLVATIVSVETAQALSLLLIVMSVIWLVLGTRLALKLAFPVLFMAFALPIWFPLSPILQGITADAVFWIARLANIPAYREYNVIMLPAGSLSIEEACSGLRYLMAALTLGALYARLNYTSQIARSLVVVVSVLAAIVGNIIRVYVVVYLAYKTDMQHPWVADHLNLGWYIFGAIMLFLLFMDAWLHNKFSSQVAGIPQVSSGLSITQHECRKPGLSRLLIPGLATILLIGSIPVMQWRIKHQADFDANNVLVVLPDGDSGWSGPYAPVTSWKPIYHGAVETLQSYSMNGESVQVYVGYYPAQRQGRELINVLNRISDTRVWTPVYSHPHVRTIHGRSVLEQLLKNKAGNKLVVWFWYEVAGQPVTSNIKAKLLQVLGLFNGKPGASVVAIAGSWSENPSSTQKILDEFSAFIESGMDVRLLQPAG